MALGLGTSLASASGLSTVYSTSITLDGTGDYLDLNEDFQSTFRDSFTIAFWCKFADGQSSVKFIIGALQDGGGNTLYLKKQSNGILHVTFKAASNQLTIATDAAAFADGATDWQHVAVTFTKNTSANTTIIIYIDGSAVALGSPSGAVSDTEHAAYVGTDLYIGARNNLTGGVADFFINGKIDDLAIWSEALTADNIAKVENSGAPFDLTSDVGDYDNSDTLVGYWRMNDGVGTNVVDSGSGGNNGTLAADATFSTDVPS